MDHSDDGAVDYGSVRGVEYVYPISQDVLMSPRPFQESGADPVIYRPEWRPPPPRVILPPLPPDPPDEEEPLVAHDWGHVFRQATGGFLGDLISPSTQPVSPLLGFSDPAEVGPVERTIGSVAGGMGAESCEGMVWTGGAPPKGFKVVNWCGKGVLRKVRRRRRRRILTASDKADISYIISTAGKGQLAASLIHKSTH